MEIYRIKHKATGLYFMPSRDHMNLSVGGKVYSHPNGWLSFAKSGTRLLVNRRTRIGKQIADGTIKIGTIIWPKDMFKWLTGGYKTYNDAPFDTNADKFVVDTDISEWEKEILS